jgi:hypothetical protein
MRRVTLLGLMMVVVVAVAVLGSLAMADGTASAKTLVGVKVPTARGAIRDAERGHSYSSIRRVAAKLMTVGDLARAFPDVNLPAWKAISKDKIWVVAVSGIPHDILNATPEHYTWGVSVIDRRTGNGMAQFAGSQGDWPPYFASLPSIAVSK